MRWVVQKKVGGGEVSGVHWQLASLLETSIKMTEVGWEELKEEPLSAHQRRTFGAGISMTTILELFGAELISIKTGNSP